MMPREVVHNQCSRRRMGTGPCGSPITLSFPPASLEPSSMASLLCSAVAAAALAAADLRLPAALSCKPLFRLLTAAAAHTDRPERLFACTCQAHECCAENAARSDLAARAPTSITLPFMSVQDVTPQQCLCADFAHVLMPPMKAFASGASPLNVAPAKSKPGCCTPTRVSQAVNSRSAGYREQLSPIVSHRPITPGLLACIELLSHSWKQLLLADCLKLACWFFM